MRFEDETGFVPFNVIFTEKGMKKIGNTTDRQKVLGINEINSDRVIIFKMKAKRYFLLFGYPYASAPGCITILSLVNNKFEVQFAGNLEIKELKLKDSKLIIKATDIQKCTINKMSSILEIVEM